MSECVLSTDSRSMLLVVVVSQVAVTVHVGCVCGVDS